MKRTNTILSSAITLALASSPLYAQEIELNSVTMDTVSGDQLGGFNHQGGLDQLFESQKEMVFHILEQIGVSEESLPPGVRNEIAKKQTSSFPAFVAFSEGLNQQDKGDFEAAEASFTRAAQLDPNFEMAAQALEALPEAEASVAQVAEKSQKEAEEEAEEEVAEAVAEEEQEVDEEVATVESEDEQLIAEAESGDGDGATSISSEPVLAEAVSDSGSEVAQQQATEDALQGGYFDKSVASFQGGIYATYVLKSDDTDDGSEQWSPSNWSVQGWGFSGKADLTAASDEPVDSDANEIKIYIANGGYIESHVSNSSYPTLTGGGGFRNKYTSGGSTYEDVGGLNSLSQTTITSVSSSNVSGSHAYYEMGYYEYDNSSPYWIASLNGHGTPVYYQLVDNKLWFAEGSTTSGAALDGLAQANAIYSYSGVVGGVSFVYGSGLSDATSPSTDIESCTSGDCGTFTADLDFGAHKVNNLSISAATSSYNVSITADSIDMCDCGKFYTGFGSSGPAPSGVEMKVGWNGSGDYAATSGNVQGNPGGEQAEVVGGVFRVRYDNNGSSPHSLTASGNFGGSR